MLVLEVDSKICVAIDEIGAGCCSGNCADLLISSDIGIAGSCRHEVRARNLAVVELPRVSQADKSYSFDSYLIDHQSLEGICYRIKVVDPSEPRMHVSCGNCEPGVDDES